MLGRPLDLTGTRDNFETVDEDGSWDVVHVELVHEQADIASKPESACPVSCSSVTKLSILAKPPGGVSLRGDANTMSKVAAVWELAVYLWCVWYSWDSLYCTESLSWSSFWIAGSENLTSVSLLTAN